jgi:SAM-dependent methyltransferase
MRLIESLRRTVTSIRRNGISGTVRNLLRNFEKLGKVDTFDAVSGTDTQQWAALSDLTIGSSNAQYGERYQPTDEGELKRALALIGGPSESATFVDLGCGKGRTLLIAARAGFKKVIGVEFAEELVRTARRNLASVAASATVEHADAADFVLPAGDLVVYMFHPFGADVMSRVTENLGRAAEQSPRPKIFVLYKNPQHKAVLDAAPFLLRVATPRWTWTPNVAIWRSRE